ncbi:hypothetical protein C8J55DRAFT_431328 [Lentinula edodes]|uniref:DUF4100 domain-containing protein n=1 Tax=Lentinula lateritia TaxID=40482 RepID=A0A9W9DLH9_9AGAR|nr:hypothetical protein C8J55DRAFT_431328 [Lentinula edodes]
MPIARTQNAPFFNGRYIEDFLGRVKQHGANAGIVNEDELVKYIVEYSSDKVKDLILYMDEFDADTKVTWKAAKEALITLYGSSDKPKEYTEEELKEFCRERSAKPSFSKASDIEDYLRAFVAIAASLKKRTVISEKEYNLYFVRGLPRVLKEWFASATPETKHTKDNPPSVAESLYILRTRFDKNSIIYEDWHKDDEEKAKFLFDDNGNRITTSIQQEIDAEDKEAYSKAQVTTSQPASTVEELAQQVEQLKELMKDSNMRGSRMNQGSDSNSRRCFICGKMCGGNNSAHPIGPRFCPETNELLSEHLITFDAQRNRYVLINGHDLPLVPKGWVGGVASYLRHQRSTSSIPSSSSVPHDTPPHLRSGNSVGLMYNDSEVLTGQAFALESVPYHFTSNPSLRSGRDTTNRYNPLDKDHRKKPTSVQKIPIEPHKQVRFDPSSTSVPPHIQTVPQNEPSQIPAKVSIPPPSNPINREQGWKNSRPGIPRGGQEVVMQDGDKKNSGPQYHFTSKVQDLANPESTFSHIGDMKVEIPLFQLLGISPQLSKLFLESTRTRREYGPIKETKQAESTPYHNHFEASGDEQAALTSAMATWGSESGESNLYVAEDDPNISDFVFKCSNAVAQIPAKRFFAMTVGNLRVIINDVEFLAMIDTGSELNVGGAHLPEAASLPMDYDGTRWSLKGINGDFERLRGCAVNAPIRIGGHDFTHHIFISRTSIGRHDIILGQPFLQWFSARVDYERGAHAKLFLWADGDRTGKPTLMVSITDPNDGRNASAIRLGTEVKPKNAFIEEVNEADF